MKKYKSMILHIIKIFINMGRNLKKDEDKKIKISITIDKKLNKRIEDDLINKSRLIEKLIKEHYEKKDM